jgi:hypothetical protein
MVNLASRRARSKADARSRAGRGTRLTGGEQVGTPVQQLLQKAPAARLISAIRAAEAAARPGHDTLPFRNLVPANYTAQLEPVDDVVAQLINQNGGVGRTVEYLGKP